MLKKTLNKHTREFLETNLPENFFLFKKSNKKRKQYFDLKGNFIKTHVYKLKKAAYNFKHKTVNTLQSIQHEKSTHLHTANPEANFLFSLNIIKSQFEKRQSRASDFKNKLKEKKKLSILYGNLSNKAVKKAIRKAEILSGSCFAGENLLDILESRLDIILYRALFFPSIKSAKQWITYNKILVNSLCINIPSYHVKYGDIISIAKKNRKYVASTMLKHFAHYDTFNKKISQVNTSNNTDKHHIQENFFPGWAVKNVYKNITSLNKMFAHCLILCENMYCVPKKLSQNISVKSIPYFFTNYREILSSIFTIANTPGKQSKRLFLQMCENISKARNIVDLSSSKKHLNFLTTSSRKHASTFIEKSIRDISNNMLKIFYIFSDTNLRIRKLPANTSANLSLIQYFKQPFFGDSVDQAGTFTTEKSFNDIQYKSKLEKSVYVKRTFFIHKNISDIILKAPIINAFNKTNINLYNMFCKLTFTKNWQQSVILFTRQKNISHYISNFISSFFLKNFFVLKSAFKKKHRYIISSIYLNTLVNQIKLSNSFLFKFTVDLLNKNYLIQDIHTKQNYMFPNSEKITHTPRRLIWNPTMSSLPEKLFSSQIHETTIGKVVPYVQEIQTKTKNLYKSINYPSAKYLNKVEILRSAHVQSTNFFGCLGDQQNWQQQVPELNLEFNSRQLSTSNSKNTLIIKYKILLSIINSNFLTTIKEIFKNISANCLASDRNKISILANVNYTISHIKYYDLLLFLKLKKFFFDKTNYTRESKINVKPLNLEISYKTLTIIYLYPTQKLVLPCSLDVELLLRYSI